MLRKGYGGLYKAPTKEKRGSKRLRGERDQIKFLDNIIRDKIKFIICIFKQTIFQTERASFLYDNIYEQGLCSISFW